MAKVIINHHGTKNYTNDDGVYHREDGPALIYQECSKRWYTNGRLMGAWFSNGTSLWYNDNQPFRQDGPNSDEPNGRKKWNTGNSRWPKL